MAAAESTNHPGPASVELPAEMLQAMIDHARAENPNEMCGVIVGDRPAADGGKALRWEPARNLAASPLRYEIHPDDLLRLSIATEDAGRGVLGDRPQSHPHPTAPERHGSRPCLLPGCSVPAHLARGGRAVGRGVAHRGGRDLPGRAPHRPLRDGDGGSKADRHRGLRQDRRALLRVERPPTLSGTTPLPRARARADPAGQPGSRARLRRRNPDDRGAGRRPVRDRCRHLVGPARDGDGGMCRAPRSSWPT